MVRLLLPYFPDKAPHSLPRARNGRIHSNCNPACVSQSRRLELNGARLRKRCADIDERGDANIDDAVMALGGADGRAPAVGIGAPPSCAPPDPVFCRLCKFVSHANRRIEDQRTRP
jgi:hypothetical protein